MPPSKSKGYANIYFLGLATVSLTFYYGLLFYSFTKDKFDIKVRYLHQWLWYLGNNQLKKKNNNNNLESMNKNNISDVVFDARHVHV